MLERMIALALLDPASLPAWNEIVALPVRAQHLTSKNRGRV